MIRQAAMAICFLLFAQTTIASDCVTGVILDGVRPDEHRAVGYVIAVDTYSNVAACNDAMAYKAKLLPRAQAAQNLVANRADSLTFTCKVPPNCSPDDEGTVEPYSRVVYLHD